MLIDQMISKRLKERDQSQNSLYFELKEEIAAQAIIIEKQAEEIEELVSLNTELQDEVEALKEELGDLKCSMETHGESLRQIDGRLSSLLYDFNQFIPSSS